MTAFDRHAWSLYDRELLERDRVRQPVRSDPGPLERRQVRPAAEALPHLVDKASRTYVPFEQVTLMRTTGMRTASGTMEWTTISRGARLYLDALPCVPVQPPSSFTLTADHIGGSWSRGSGELRLSTARIAALVYAFGAPCLEHRGGGVERLRPPTQRHFRIIFFLESHERPQGLGLPPRADDQEAGGKGVERARMSDLLYAEHAADLVHDIERRPTRRLAHKQQLALGEAELTARFHRGFS
jgi:hypothetical protein